jgi:hypothetical protein
MDRDGKPCDPWIHTMRLVLRPEGSTDDAEAFTFETRTPGGRGAVCELCKVYGRARRARPGQLPIVELAVEKINEAELADAYAWLGELAWVHAPKFKVVGWDATELLRDLVNRVRALENARRGDAER